MVRRLQKATNEGKPLVSTFVNTAERFGELAAPAGVPLEALRFPAALIANDARISEVNADWRVTHPDFLPGQSLARWCEELHSSAPELRAALCFAIHRVLSGKLSRFTQDYDDTNGQYRITLSMCPPGALVLHQEVSSPQDQQSRWKSHKLETVGRLAAGVAHDFANILTMISGYSELIVNRMRKADPLRPEVDEIRNAANRGARLTGQLLGYTRGEEMRSAPLDLNALIHEMLRMIRPVIGEHVELETGLSPDLGKVTADRGHMEQVILNLVLNARDATPSGGRIRIETMNAEMGKSVVLKVTDTGQGIDAAAIDRVFEPFFTTKTPGQGTGLGLSTVKAIVKQYGGDVWVRSAPGHGAEFTVCLPRTPETRTSEQALATANASGGAETVLLVEDEEGVRKLLSYVLARSGYDVIEATNGEEALDAFDRRGGDIHLVLTDMVMPRMNGRELGERLRQIRPALKIIYMSGYTDDVLLQTGALGPDMCFLPKPLRPDVLTARVREALDTPSRPFNPS